MFTIEHEALLLSRFFQWEAASVVFPLFLPFLDGRG